ncbi:MAG: hypothetical protein D6730_08820 [Bacteroidetes bacterium]|nr:MAG: hypothetical protein D6730_08820 [Bacteroidota bacterium]
MQIVPALYIKDGKLAYYRPGDYEHLEYIPRDPYDLIRHLEEVGVTRIMLIDLDASLPGEQTNAGLIGSLANTTIIELEVGGGIDNMAYLKSLQYAGVDYFILGSVIIDNFNFLLEIAADEHIKNERILISLDVKNGELTTHGWTQVVTDIGLKELMWKCINAGFHRFMITEIDSDRPDVNFYRELVEQFPGSAIVAAGRINTFEEVEQLEAAGVEEVVVGDEIYQDDALLKQMVEFNKARQNQ